MPCTQDAYTPDWQLQSGTCRKGEGARRPRPASAGPSPPALHAQTSTSIRRLETADLPAQFTAAVLVPCTPMQDLVMCPHCCCLMWAQLTCTDCLQSKAQRCSRRLWRRLCWLGRRRSSGQREHAPPLLHPHTASCCAACDAGWRLRRGCSAVRRSEVCGQLDNSIRGGVAADALGQGRSLSPCATFRVLGFNSRSLCHEVDT